MWEDRERQKNLIPENHPQLELILKLQRALRKSWRRELCNVDDLPFWSPENPAFGQCLTTALVVDDYLPGKIPQDEINDHFWNESIDLTREQFPVDIIIKATRMRSREELLEGERAEKARTFERYLELRVLVEEVLRYS